MSKLRKKVIHGLIGRIFAKITAFALDSLEAHRRNAFRDLGKRISMLQRDDLLTEIPNKGKFVTIGIDTILTRPRGLVLGNNVKIGHNCFLESRGGILIGDNTLILSNVNIVSSAPNFNGELLPQDGKAKDQQVKIGHNVIIGAGCTLLPGITIGDGAVIGPGTVVNQDIAKYAVISSNTVSHLTQRDAALYDQLAEAAKWSDSNGNALSKRKISAYNINAEQLGDKLFFVLGTGRNGSTTIAKILSKQKGLVCLHEPKLALIKLSTDFAHGLINDHQVKEQLRLLYNGVNVYPNIVYGESDQKLSNLVPFLRDIFPKAKFIWLLRNPVDSVNSMHSRGWFADQDLFPSEQDDGIDEVKYRGLFTLHRLHADKLGEMSSTKWRSMTAFARNCWYWTYWNKLIETELA